MVWHMKLKLPPLKVIQRSTSGEVAHRLVPRGSDPSEKYFEEERHHDACVQVSEDVDNFGTQSSSWASEPSLHEITQKATIGAWKEIRPALLKASIESSAMLPDQLCVLCNAKTASYRCLQCAPWAYYCCECFKEAHSKTNIFHTGEVWENGKYKPVVMHDKKIDVRPKHLCTSTKLTQLCCIDEYGIEHNISFTFCQCEPLTVTMVRARLWPSSPQRPNIAFTFDFLDWAEALLLECQVALKDLCKALCFRCPHLVWKRKNIYSSLSNAFEEYRWMKVELRHLTFLCPELDRGNVCPACPKKSGSLILSMDALFGLPRKKAAGHSYQDPLHRDIFFGDQNEVDEFVASSAPIRKKDKVCSEFLAGNALRSSQRYHALDETAIFGAACRHEFPFQFINLKHGERLSYGVWLLNKILERIPSNVTLHLMYDIACMLVRHLKSASDSDYERVKFSIPSFHAYGHNAPCQVLYSPLYCEGIGLSDGEVMERLWSYLRRFGRMTKEMHPSHRTDVLCHALIYYGSITKKKLATLLVHRWTKASEMKKSALQSYLALTSSLNVTVSADLVMQWIQEEKLAMKSDIIEQTISTDWKIPYFHMLHCYYMTREKLINAGLSEIFSLREKVFNMESQLAEMERRCGILSRWKTSDEEYMDARRSFMMEKRSQLYTSLWSCVVKRHYLLRMKAKYAGQLDVRIHVATDNYIGLKFLDGQKIAKRLCKNITKETLRARQLLQDYNETCLQIDHEHLILLASEVLSPDSLFWQNLSPASQNVPLKVRKDIIQAFLRTRRSEEEMELLKAEMNSVLSYWFERIECVLIKLQELDGAPSPQAYHWGAKCLLHRLLREARMIHSKAVIAFNSVIEITAAHKTLSDEMMYEMQQHDEDDHTSSSESESDYDDDHDEL